LILKSVVHAADISSPTMDFADFKSQGYRVTQEFHDQWLAETANPALKENPPPPFMKWTDYRGFVASQINFTSK
jgi:hypothetical protein